jgi:hypothetical protein
LSSTFGATSTEDISSNETRRWRGIRNRFLQSEYALPELSLYKEFVSSLEEPSGIITLRGYVTRIGGRRFVLRPSPVVFDFAVLCDASSIRNLPADFELVEVRGRRCIPKRRIELFTKAPLIIAEDVQPSQISIDRIKPNLTVKDASDAFVQNFVDTPEEVKRSLLYSIISSPRDAYRTGGLTDTMVPLEPEYSISLRQLVSDIENYFPSDLTSSASFPLSIKGVGNITVTPFSWNLRGLSSNEIVDSETLASLISRKMPINNQNELSINIAGEVSAPRTLHELWIGRADLRMIVDNRVQRFREPQSGIDLEIAKYLIGMHMNFPKVAIELQSGLDKFVKKRLAKLKHDYDPEGFSGLIDPDIEFGSPRTILHIASVLARADGSSRVTTIHLQEATEYFDEMNRHLFDAWEDKGYRFGKEKLERKLARMSKTAERIYNYVLNHPDCSKSEVREEFPRISDTSFNNEFQQLLEQTLIYKSSDLDESYSVSY